MATQTTEPFSHELEEWLQRDGDKTLGGLQEVFGERSFAVMILLLMAPAALPLPTGGVTHVLEAVTVLLALEMVAGRRTVWLPDRWRSRSLGPVATEKAIPAVVRLVRRCERFARPRAAGLLDNAWIYRALGLVVGALAIAAALAPPFSGLDTLPALGAVLIALAILLGDLLLAALGLVVGGAGAVLIIAVGAAIARFMRDLL
jgi:hypothetical protein